MRKLTIVSPEASSTEGRCITRRAILETLAAAALTACASHTVITSSDPQEAGAIDAGTDDASNDDGSTSQCPDASSAGSVDGYPPGSWKANGAYIIGHDAAGLFAFSTRCTHEGCTINPPSTTSGATSCPCHGARFDGNGAVVAGPARTPLPHFALSVCEGMIYVDTSTSVAATTRTAAA